MPRFLDLPRRYNAATHFIDRHIAEGRGSKTAFIDDKGSYTYADLAARVNRAGNLLRAQGVRPEQRVMLALLDSIDFPAMFFGAMKIGAVPVPVNTLLTTPDYDFLLRDSRAAALVVSDALLEKFRPIISGQPYLEQTLISGQVPATVTPLDRLMAEQSDRLEAAATTPDDIGFWLYSSGSTGSPKGAIHLHGDLVHTAVLYGQDVLGIREDDVVFSAAKLFFAYGLGNAMTFPLHVGATAVLMAERPTPQAVMQRLKQHQASIFYGVPTLYAGILAAQGITKESGSDRLRACVSAGEALPEEIGKRWKALFGVDILDGIGSTEMLHIFLSNRPGDVRYGTTGRAVPGYDLRIVGENGEDVPPGEIGELLVSGPSSAIAYWNNRAKSLSTFHGPWTRTGDKYVCDKDGYYTYAGRSDDMLKVSGIWVSPFEVESALQAHPKVLEVAVVAHPDSDDLIKPKAYVVLKDGIAGDDALIAELQTFVKDRLAPYKYPRWVEFVPELPKTATGKIQRFKLRSRA
ncbi:MAG TPA: benzoate-CoA ligase family protein [Ferrovibrio sp.]|uniref:benzoate-CoA ligase family protein n=1 Tax=Ferrovibrio sp. TaxID=1917215 RepID=UPI002B4AEBE7|nr:benzoate-CoA ligase family protein [Ferrovibrio sp.]HLT78568.1 benzoate-CoA ligase family protein [Ferrovibrio sp.]